MSAGQSKSPSQSRREKREKKKLKKVLRDLEQAVHISSTRTALQKINQQTLVIQSPQNRQLTLVKTEDVGTDHSNLNASKKYQIFHIARTMDKIRRLNYDDGRHAPETHALVILSDACQIAGVEFDFLEISTCVSTTPIPFSQARKKRRSAFRDEYREFVRVMIEDEHMKKVFDESADCSSELMDNYFSKTRWTKKTLKRFACVFQLLESTWEEASAAYMRYLEGQKKRKRKLAELEGDTDERPTKRARREEKPDPGRSQISSTNVSKTVTVSNTTLNGDTNRNPIMNRARDDARMKNCGNIAKTLFQF